MCIQCAVCFEFRPEKSIVRTRKVRPFTYERLNSHVKENAIHEEASKRKTEPTVEKKKKQKNLGFFSPSKASSESEAGSSVISREDVSRQKMERRNKSRHLMLQEKLNLTLRREALPNNLCCGLFDYEDLINEKKQEGLLVYSKYFSSAVNDDYKSRSIGESTIFYISFFLYGYHITYKKYDLDEGVKDGVNVRDIYRRVDLSQITEVYDSTK